MGRKKPERPSYRQHYVKKGRKYVPYNDPIAYEGLGPGAWLVIVEENSKSIRTAVNPKFIELEASLRYLEDGLCKAISEASEMRSQTTPMTEKERRAWKEFRRIMGDDMPRFVQYPSNCEIAQKGCEYIRRVMMENNCDAEKIKEKYEVKERKFTNPILDLEM